VPLGFRIIVSIFAGYTLFSFANECRVVQSVDAAVSLPFRLGILVIASMNEDQ